MGRKTKRKQNFRNHDISNATFGNDLVGDKMRSPSNPSLRLMNFPCIGARGRPRASAHTHTSVAQNWGKIGLNHGGGAQMARVNLERVSLWDEMVKSGWCN